MAGADRGELIVGRDETAGAEDGQQGLDGALGVLARFDVLEALVAVHLQQVAQGDFIRGGGVDQRAHRDGVLEDPGGGERVLGAEDLHGLVAGVDLDAQGTGEADDPDEAGAAGEQLGDLLLQFGLVLAAVGVLDGQRREGALPARGRLDSADDEIGGAEVAVVTPGDADDTSSTIYMLGEVELWA